MEENTGGSYKKVRAAKQFRSGKKSVKKISFKQSGRRKTSKTIKSISRSSGFGKSSSRTRVVASAVIRTRKPVLELHKKRRITKKKSAKSTFYGHCQCEGGKMEVVETIAPAPPPPPPLLHRTSSNTEKEKKLKESCRRRSLSRSPDRNRKPVLSPHKQRRKLCLSATTRCTIFVSTFII